MAAFSGRVAGRLNHLGAEVDAHYSLHRVGQCEGLVTGATTEVQYHTASILASDFVKPGRGTVRASIEIGDALLDDIRRNTRGGDKYLPELRIPVRDAAGDVVAKVTKRLYVRRKTGQTRAANPAGS